MQIYGLPSNSSYSASSSQQTEEDSSSFQNHFLDAASSNDDAVQEFLEYAKETPAQRMFDSWLESQHISKAEYNSMTQEQKQKLIDEFREQMKAKMKAALGTSSSETTPSSVSS
jgi:hypothetical protein